MLKIESLSYLKLVQEQQYDKSQKILLIIGNFGSFSVFHDIKSHLFQLQEELKKHSVCLEKLLKYNPKNIINLQKWSDKYLKKNKMQQLIETQNHFYSKLKLGNTLLAQGKIKKHSSYIVNSLNMIQQQRDFSDLVIIQNLFIRR